MNYIRLPLEKIDNCRDLGGYPTIYGKVTSWNKFVRSANLNSASKKDIDFLKKYGVTTIIDLRGEDEISLSFDKVEEIKKEFEYYNVPLARKTLRDEEIKKIIDKKLTIGESYYNLIDNFEGIREIFNIFADSKGACLFHCHEGKDRTGVIAMLLLLLVGVSRKDVIANYEVSSANLGYIERYNPKEKMSVFRLTLPSFMKTAIDYINRKYSSIEVFLKEYCNIEDEKLSKIKDKFLESQNE